MIYSFQDKRLTSQLEAPFYSKIQTESLNETVLHVDLFSTVLILSHLFVYFKQYTYRYARIAHEQSTIVIEVIIYR